MAFAKAICKYVLASEFGKFLANILMNMDDWNNVKFYEKMVNVQSCLLDR